MSPGADCADDFVRLGSGKDELDVLWWLLNNFEKSIEALWGDHVSLIKNEDFVAVSRGCKDCAFPKVPGIVNTVVTGGINLDHIERAWATCCKLYAAWTLATRIVGRTFFTVQAAGKNPGARCLATTPGSREKVCVVNSIRVERRL